MITMRSLLIEEIIAADKNLNGRSLPEYRKKLENDPYPKLISEASYSREALTLRITNRMFEQQVEAEKEKLGIKSQHFS